MHRVTHALVLVLALMTLVADAGCSRSPEAQKARYLDRGGKYFGRKEYANAIIEYRNVLRIDATNAIAIRNLGLAHYQSGQFREAVPYLRRASELEPQNEDVRVKLGTIYLIAHRPDDAREHATAVLEHDTRNFEALMLLTDSAQRAEDVDAALRRLEEARPQFQDRMNFHLALGKLYLRKRDLLRAEEAFKDAVARDPNAVQGHSALGEFYLLKQDFAKAEEELKRAADLAPIASPARMQLADFYLRTGKRDVAKAILAELTKKEPTYLPAWRRRADIALGEQRYDEALEQLAPVFKKNPADVEAQFLRGRIHLAKHQPNDAINDFQAVLKLEPSVVSARFHLALAQLEAGNIQQAKAELKQAIVDKPDFNEARLVLARLNLQTGAVQPAIDDLENLTETMPQSAVAQNLLGSAYLAKGDRAKAVEAFKKYAALTPKNAHGPYTVGLALAMQGKRAEAIKQFEAALALAPEFVDPLAQLVNFKLMDKDAAGATELVKKQIAAAPKSGPLHELLGRVYVAQGKKDQAEEAFRAAIDLDPRLVSAYSNLATLYARDKHYDDALAKLDKASQLAPKDPAPLMLIGMVHEQRGDVPKAEEAYEKVLALNARFAPAANNLAYLYTEHGGDKERALQLAQTAKEVAPEDPSISDTLGWVLYHRGVYQRAVTLLQESATKLPDNPTIQYHLGLAYAKVGNKEGAKKALGTAVSSKHPFRELPQAKQALAELN